MTTLTLALISSSGLISTAQAAGATFTQVSLSATVSGTSVYTRTTVKASSSTNAAYYGVCVRSSTGANVDFWKKPATISTTGTAYRSDTKSFAVGTYTYSPCVNANGAWRPVAGTAKRFTVGAAATTYTQLSLAAQVSGGAVTSTTKVKASTATAVPRYGVCVRSSTGANLDYPNPASTLSTTGTTYRSTKTFAKGAYSYFSCFYAGGRWRHGGATRSFTVGTTAGTTTPAPTTTVKPTGVAGTWRASFADEFNGTSVDKTKWNISENHPMNKVVARAANVAEYGGNAVLTLSDSANGAMITSGIVDGRGANHYTLPVGGFAEARVYFPGNGTSIYNWPAWWTTGYPWPATGEHDIAEVLSGKLTVNYHSPTGAHNQGAISGYWGNSFHTYGLHRKAHSADVYWDGKLVKSYATDDNSAGQSLLINVGAGSTARAYGAASQVKVDYVRAFIPG